jgi:hypothetical protein
MSETQPLEPRAALFLALNLVAALAEATVALMHVFAPAIFYPGVDATSAFVSVAELFAIRNVVLSAAVIYCSARHRYRFLAGLCVIMALIQAPDAVLGVYAGNPGQVIAPLVCAALHLLCAHALSQRSVPTKVTLPSRAVLRP